MKKNTDPIRRSVSSSGFTLIELLVVIGIIMVLVGLVIGGYSAMSGAMAGRQTAANLRVAQMASELYVNEISGGIVPYQLTTSKDSENYGGLGGSNRLLLAGDVPPSLLKNSGSFGELDAWDSHAGQCSLANQSMYYLLSRIDTTNDYIAEYKDKITRYLDSKRPKGENYHVDGNGFIDGWGRPMEYFGYVASENHIVPLSNSFYWASTGTDGQFGDVTPTDNETYLDTNNEARDEWGDSNSKRASSTYPFCDYKKKKDWDSWRGYPPGTESKGDDYGLMYAVDWGEYKVYGDEYFWNKWDESYSEDNQYSINFTQ